MSLVFSKIVGEEIAGFAMKGKFVRMLFFVMFHHAMINTKFRAAQTALEFFNSGVKGQVRFHRRLVLKFFLTIWAGYLIYSWLCFVLPRMIIQVFFLDKVCPADTAGKRSVELMSSNVV